MTGDGLKHRVGRRFFRAKAQRFGANGGDARGCRNPLGGAVVATFAVLGLRVKTLDYDLDNGGVRRRYLLEGVVVEFRFSFVPLSSVASLATRFFSVYL